MRVSVALLLSALALVACADCSRGLSVDLGPRLPQPNVAKLIVAGMGTCTAWKAGPELIVSAGHCSMMNEGIPVEGYSLEPTGNIALPLVDDDIHDVSVFLGHIDGESLRLAANDPDVGDPIWTVGYGHGFYGMAVGYWAGRADGKGMISLVAAGGMSGSPVLNARGEVCGVLVSGYRGSATTFVVGVEDIRRAVNTARHLVR